jgi:hypothetical protein
MKAIHILLSKNLDDFISEEDIIEFKDQINYEVFELTPELCAQTVASLLQSMEQGMEYMFINEETYKKL